MTYFPELVQLTIKSIDGKAVAATKIGTTVNDGRKFIPMFAIFHVTAATAIVTPCTLSIGTNSSTYNNILAATALTGMTAIDLVMQLGMNAAASSVVAANTDIFANITVGATGTSISIDVTLLGFYK